MKNRFNRWLAVALAVCITAGLFPAQAAQETAASPAPLSAADRAPDQTSPASLPAAEESEPVGEISVTATPVLLSDAPTSGTCGAAGYEDSVTWSIDPVSDTFTISGAGPMMDYSSENPPWYDWIYSNSYRGQHIMTVVIEEGITEIYDLHYMKIKSLSLPSTLKKIGSCFSAQKKDYGRFELTLPASLEYISARSFYDWDNISKLTVLCPDDAFGTEGKWGDTYTFANCSYLDEVILPDGWTTIPRYLFTYSYFSRITLPSTLTTIDVGAFYKCTHLSELSLPSGLTTILGSAFQDCWALEALTLPDSVTTLGPKAFYNCYNLTGFNWPKAMLNGGSVGDNAFQNCDKITGHLTIPDNVTFGDEVFYSCDGITGVTLPASPDALGRGLFYFCYGITDAVIPEGWTAIPDRLFEYCRNLSAITFPRAPFEIGEYAFSHCDGLVDLTLPVNLTVLGRGAFYYCAGLKTLTIESPDLSYNGMGENFQGCAALTTVHLPDGLTQLAGSMFEQCTALSRIELPDSLTYIGGDAFYNCSSLTKITIPAGVTRLEYREFYGCSGLSEVIFPNTMTYIGTESFAGCTNLTRVVIPASVTKIANRSFHSRFAPSGLRQVRFLGNAPEIDTEGYYVTDPPFPDGTSVYFYTGTEGWTTPTWNGYNSYPILGKPKFHDSAAAYYAPIDLYHFSFTSSGSGVNGVTATYQGSSFRCSPEQSELSVGMHIEPGSFITFSCEGYHSVTLPVEVLASFNTIPFFSTDENRPFVQSVYARHSDTTSYSDLINGSFAFRSGSTTQTTEFYLDINWNGHTPGQIFLSHDLSPENGWALENGFYDAGYLSLNLHSGKDLYLSVATDQGVRNGVKLSTIVTPAQIDQGLTIGENTDQDFTPADNGTTDASAFLSKFNFSFNFFDSMSLTVDIQRDGTVKGLLGVTATEDLDEDGFNTIYGSIKDGLAYNSDDLKDITKARSTLQSLLSNRGSGWTLGKCSLATEGEFSAFGYVEGKVVIGESGYPELQFYEGALGFTIGGKVEQVFQLYVNGVPVYFSGSLGNSASFTIPVATNHDLGPGLVPAFRLLKFSNDFEMKLAAGLGWDSILSAGVYGKGNLVLTGYIPFKFSETSMKGSSSFGLEVNVFSVFTTDVELFQGDDIYLWGEANATAQAATYASARRLKQMDWQSVSRDYLYAQSHLPQLFALDESNTALTRSMLCEGIYPGADVQFITCGNKYYAVWTGDPGEEVRPEANNRTKLYYSSRTKSTGSWSSPTPVVDFYWDDDDGTADFNPMLKECNGTVYVLWQNANRALTAEDTVNTLPATMDICCSVLDSGDVLATVGTEHFDTVADVTLIDDVPYIVWVSNSADSAFEGEGTYSIHRQPVIAYTDTSDRMETLVTGLHNVDAIAAQGERIWFSTDTDAAGDAIADYRVFCYEDGTSTQISGPGATKPALVNGVLTWYENGSVRVGDELVSLAADTDRYQYLVSKAGLEAVVYTVDSDVRQSALYASFNDGTGWGSPILMSGVTGNLRSFCAGFDDSGTLYVLGCERGLDPDSSNYLSGTANLNLYSATPYADLAITNATYLGQSLVRGGSLDLVIDVVNNGMAAANVLEVSVSNGTEFLANAAYEQFLPSGQSTQVYISVPLDDPEALTDLSVEVRAGGYEDQTPEDNRAGVALKLSDLSVEGVHLSGSGEQLTARTMVVNRGLTDLTDLTVTLYAEDGQTVLATQAIPSLSCGSGEIVAFPVTPGTDVQLLSIQAEAAGLEVQEENIIANNKVTVRVEGTDKANRPVCVTASASRNKDGTLCVSAHTTADENNMPLTIIAAYDSHHRMVGILSSATAFLSDTFRETDITSIRVFALDADSTPVISPVDVEIP